MFAKALRGLRRLAILFDAWMTEKPKSYEKSIPSDLEASIRVRNARVRHQLVDRAGCIRPAGSLPHTHWP